MSWTIQSKAIDTERLLLEESLFFTGNGFIGVRGNLEEDGLENTNTIRGTYLNGFHDIIDIPYGEKLYGFPETQQKLLNIFDTQSIDIWVGQGEQTEKFSLSTGNIISYNRKLHLDKGYTERQIHWRSKYGHELEINFKRLVSFTTRELFYQYITLNPISTPFPIKIVSSINGNVENYTDENDPRVGNDGAKGLELCKVEQLNDASYMEAKTYKSNLRVAVLTTTTVSNENATYQYQVEKDTIKTTISFVLDKETALDKKSLFIDTLRYNHLDQTLEKLKKDTATISFIDIKRKQQQYLTSFWKNADIAIQGISSLQEGIRFNLYHLLQSAGQDGVSNIAAKGLSGEGYEGHYFWDTEIYLLPMFTMTNPELAKNLLLYRYSILDSARDRAKEMGHNKGALFPWRTISGSECSSFFPAGTAQYHINADVAHSYIQYFLATNDLEFMQDVGTEVLIETARLWIDTGHYLKGEFRIDAVTGPDEYTCVVNNNYYTNVMAKQNLIWAVKAVNLMKIQSNDKRWEKLKQKISFKHDELLLFQHAADQMYLPVDDTLQINPQDDTFLQKKAWDFKKTPNKNYPLLLHYHPLTIYRYQVCKQPDTVLAHLLMEDEQSEAVIKKSYDYYEKVTTHDSSLSSCVFSMMGARVGYLDKAYDYFIQTARLDLDNIQGNTKDGLHMANMGGTWMAIIVGFAGMRLKESGLHFRPQLPKQWRRYAFRLQYRGRLLYFSIEHRRFKIQLLQGEPVNIFVRGEKVSIKNERQIQIDV